MSGMPAPAGDALTRRAALGRKTTLNYELIAATVKHICGLGEAGSILIFLPGLAEIKRSVGWLCVESYTKREGSLREPAQ